MREMVQSPLLDEAIGIKFNGTKEIFMKVMTTFTESAEKTSKEIDTLYKTNDFENYIIKVHGLKSSARIVGAPMLSKVAEHLELSGKAGDFEEIHRKHQELILLYEDTVRELCDKYDLKQADDLFAGEKIDSVELLAKLEMILQCNESFDYDTVDMLMGKLINYEMPDCVKTDMKALKDAVYDIDQMKIDEVVKICIDKVRKLIQ